MAELITTILFFSGIFIFILAPVVFVLTVFGLIIFLTVIITIKITKKVAQEKIANEGQDNIIKSDKQENGSKKTNRKKRMSVPDIIFFISSVIFVLHFFISFIVVILLFYLGAFIDGSMYNPSGIGHAVPIFVVIVPGIGLFGVGFIGIVLLLLVIVSFIVMMIFKIIKLTEKNKR